MRWFVFVIFAVIGLVFDTSLGDVLRINETWQIRPSLCGMLAVFIALSAPRTAALWACFILGLLLDLSHPLAMPGGGELHAIGPYALGYVVGGYLVLQGRTMVFRRRPLTIGVMTFVCLIAVHIVAVALYVVRSWYFSGPLYWMDTTTLADLLRRFLIALYSGLLAIPIGWLLVRSVPLWGFQTVSHRAAAPR